MLSLVQGSRGCKFLHHVVEGRVELSVLLKGLREGVTVLIDPEHLCSVAAEHEQRPVGQLGGLHLPGEVFTHLERREENGAQAGDEKRDGAGELEWGWCSTW